MDGKKITNLHKVPQQHTQFTTI